jgi:magnesium chelatase family protein
LLDRIDLHLAMHNEPFSLSTEHRLSEPSTATAAAQVRTARQCQAVRQQGLNAHLGIEGLRNFCALAEADANWLEQAIVRLGLSRRASHRTLKVARTIADLAGSEQIARVHLAEALQYRQLDRQQT